MKPQHLEAKYDQQTGLITLSFDGMYFSNIHFKDGFEKAFDRLVEVLSEKFDVSVGKTRWVCDDNCTNCQEVGTYYTVGCKGYVEKNGEENKLSGVSK